MSEDIFCLQSRGETLNAPACAVVLTEDLIGNAFAVEDIREKSRQTAVLKIGSVFHADHFVFGTRGALVGEDVHANQCVGALDQLGGGAEMRFVVVYAGDDRHAQQERRAAASKHVRVATDALLIYAGVAQVQRRIGDLPVHHDQIAGFHGVGKHRVGGIAAGFDGGVNAVQPTDDR